MTSKAPILNAKPPPPPATLSAEQRAVWVALTRAVRPDYFLESDLVLLEQYVSAVVGVRKARKRLQEEGEIVDGKINAAFIVLDHETKRCTTLSMRLRLSPQSRLDQKKAAVQLRPTKRPPWEVEADPEKTALERYGLN